MVDLLKGQLYSAPTEISEECVEVALAEKVGEKVQEPALLVEKVGESGTQAGSGAIKPASSSARVHPSRLPRLSLSKASAGS